MIFHLNDLQLLIAVVKALIWNNVIMYKILHTVALNMNVM